jgi:hypothetical protein
MDLGRAVLAGPTRDGAAAAAAAAVKTKTKDVQQP